MRQSGKPSALINKGTSAVVVRAEVNYYPKSSVDLSNILHSKPADKSPAFAIHHDMKLRVWNHSGWFMFLCLVSISSYSLRGELRFTNALWWFRPHQSSEKWLTSSLRRIGRLADRSIQRRETRRRFDSPRATAVNNHVKDEVLSGVPGARDWHAQIHDCIVAFWTSERSCQNVYTKTFEADPQVI